MMRKYEKPSTKVVELRQGTQLLTASGGNNQGQMQRLESFDNDGDPLAGE